MQPVTNAHTHLELSDLAHLCPPEPVCFSTWMRRLIWNLIWRRGRDVRAAVERGIGALRVAGTTHVGDVTASWQSVEPLLESGLQGAVYLEVAGLQRERALARLEQAKARITEARAHPGHGRMQVGLSLHAPYSCHPDLLRTGAEWCRVEDVPLCVHVAESPTEVELLLYGRTSSVDWPTQLLARALRLWPTSAPGQRPVAYLASLGVLDARPLLVHAVQVTDEEIGLIAQAGCAVAHCPRSNERLSCGRMPLERYLAPSVVAGVPVYLGTDSLASSPSLDVREEAAFAQALHTGRVGPEQIAQCVHRALYGENPCPSLTC
jgi:cytosine/adenosine deaminase-related metal-dependent hydrolase